MEGISFCPNVGLGGTHILHPFYIRCSHPHFSGSSSFDMPRPKI